MATAVGGDTITIREAAAATGVPAHTLRYYERVGLISGVERGPGGERRYAAADLEWIAFVKRLRATGMPVRMMVRFAQLRRSGRDTLPDRAQMLDDHADSVRHRMRELQEHVRAIDAKRERLRQQARQGGT